MKLSDLQEFIARGQKAQEAVDLIVRAAVRGKILCYLALIYPQSVTPWLLQGELDLWGYPVSIDDLRVHVAVLAEKEFVTVQSYNLPGARTKEAILVKITARGIDYYDGRLPADPAIYMKPK